MLRPGGYWWLAPSCRHDVMACIPLVTASNGWFLQPLLQWSTAYGIPAAVGIIPSFADWSRTVKTTRSLFYWWVPDTTFLELQPESIVFPPFRASEWVLGNKRTSGSGTYIAKLTSPNLRQKSPRLRSFISKLSMDLNTVMDILQDVRTLPLSSLDAWQDPACSWITRHEHIWSKWIPVDTNCFLGFGVVDEHGTFLPSKTGAVSCDVCPPGTFSEDLPDGQSRRCTPCPPGSSQNKAAASRCHECQPGSVGATEGSVACTPCAVGFYQDASGKAACVACSNDTTTLLLGASKPEDCVCQIDLIESNLQCVPCGEGLTCPRGSTVEQLMHGQNTTAGERPQILQSYFSWPEEPLEIYKCPGQHCPGGVPGSCTEVRLGPTCDECPARMYATSDGCQSCEIPLVAAWIGGLCGLLLLIISVYYFAETRYMLKASLVECAKIGCDMTLNFMQNLGVLNSVFVPWPEGLRNLLKFSALFLFNLRSLGFNCALGSAVQQYMTMVSFFFGMTLSWPCLGYLSQFHCFRKRNLAWKFHRTLGVTGSFLQLSFTTLCNVGLVPFMCFSHPNGRKSIAKYPNIFCGSPDHLTMQTLAVFILILGLTHFIMCCWAIWSAPAWSVKARRRLPAVHFLIANFKPSVWWFGAVILLRGPLISLPTVVATDLPGVNLALLICVWLSYYSIQLVCLPWKAPILNLVDGISTMLFLVLLAVSLHLEPVIAESILILEILGVGVYYLSLGVIVCVSILSIMLMVLKRFRCSARTNHIVNLGQLPDPKEMLETIEQIYFNLKAKQDMGELVNKMSTTLSADDLHIVQKALDILSTDCELGESVSTSRTSFYRISANRISQMSGTSLSLMVQDMDEAAQSKVSKRLKEEESISEIAESGEIEKEEAREDFPEPNSVDISAEEDTILEENLDEVDVKL
ncbi:unnamed protein product [Durusdinium trenchii]|uniref:Tyrosine-protein kinase ephrin type A/B receptor-like domain-containing protein n=1 Tax=Durusdinium trenchii TaxID=1381693 RepID=A0ABP0IQJ0_9DINO